MTEQERVKYVAQLAQKLVDWVSTVTQADPDGKGLPHEEDWRRNAEQLFLVELRKAEDHGLECDEHAIRKLKSKPEGGK